MKTKKKKAFQFSPAFYVPGTIVEAVFAHNRAHDGQFEVRYAVRNGPHSWCIETTTPHPDQKLFAGMNQSFNIDFVTRIVRYGSGKRAPGRFMEHPAYGSQDSRERDLNDTAKPKHRNSYCTWSHVSLVIYLLEDLRENPGYRDHIVDTEKLVKLLIERGVLRFESSWHWMYPVRKSCLKKAIRQLLPKCYVKAAKEQKRQREADDAQYYRDVEDEWDREWDAKHSEGTCYDLMED